MGYAVMNAGQSKEAISIFEYNVELYPASANVYDSLGEAQENSKQFAAALANYKKALELGKKNGSPSLDVFQKNIDRLTESKKTEEKAAEKDKTEAL